MIKKIKSYYIFSKCFIVFAITSFLMKIYPKKNLEFRKWAAKTSVPLLVNKIEIEGEIDESADLFLSNHQRMIDIPIIEYLLPHTNLAWVAKKELGDIFLFKNLLTKSGGILIERENKKSLIELIKKADDRLKKGQKIIIFPEGTRNKNSKKLLPFKAGAKLLAEKYNLKVQPLLLLGVDEIMKNEPFEISPNKLKVVALPTITADKKSNWYKKLQEEMQKKIDEYYAEKEKRS